MSLKEFGYVGVKVHSLMKAITAILMLFLVHAVVRGAPTLAVGQIVTISGNISSVNMADGSFSIGYERFAATSTSALTINGKRGNLADLQSGMKVTGSAEVARPDGSRSELKKIIRFITATTEPAGDRPGVSTPSQDPRAFPAPIPTREPYNPEQMESLKKKLSGTFWMIPNGPNRPGGNLWVSLNDDGTTTGPGTDRPGTWRVTGSSTIRVEYFGPGLSVGTSVRFNAELNKGEDLILSHGLSAMPGRPRRDAVSFSWIRNDSPTPEMVAKVEARSNTPAGPSSPSSSPGSAAATAPVTAETQQAASDLIKSNHNNLVFVTGNDGAGSGFIADIDGARWLITNAHVAAGINNADFKTLDGTVVHGGAAGVALGHDICRIALPSGGKPFEVMKDVDQTAGVGDEVVVLGNAEGSGVINTIIGKIVGIGPNLVEIDAQFVPGNSGSPIVHLKTGKVIGVATYTVTRKYDATTKEKMKDPVIRRFGYRLDSVKTWQPIVWPTFYAQAAAVEKVHELTLALDDFFRDLYESKNRVTKSRHTHPVIKTRILQWMESKGNNHSQFDRENADATFISFLRIACQTDITNVQPSLTYDYFQRRLADEQKVRTEMSKAFTEIIKNIRE